MQKWFSKHFIIILFCFPLIGSANNSQLAQAALEQVGKTLIYDPRYIELSYPDGDISIVRGVCSDVVIRALRTQQIDLQRLVHEDMQKNFAVYPHIWGLTKTDKNIDHRRVPNLEVFFKRQGKSLVISKEASAYKAGDIVSWRLDSGVPHIGIVSKNANKENTRLLVIHNIGGGVQEEDVLFAWTIVGHYRYFK